MKSKQKVTQKLSEKQRYRHKVLFVWGIPVLCGIFSFVYWFIFVPLLWSTLPHVNWPLLWFSLYGGVAFLVWLAIMVGAFFLWRHKKLTIVKSPPGNGPKDRVCYEASNNTGGYKETTPQFPTKTSAVQPVVDTPPSLYRNTASSSSVCIQVQPQDTPSLYNARTGRDSFDTGYRLDISEPTSSSVSVQSVIPKPEEISRQNSGVLLLKKMDSIKLDENTQQKRISSSESEESIDFKNVPRDEGDGLEDSEKASVNNGLSARPIVEDNLVKATHFQAQASVEKTPESKEKNRPPSLSRDESFKGLPEMKEFGNYLQLVTIDTPMSPRDAFFSELLNQPQEEDVKLRSAGDRKSYCIGDLSSAEERINKSRKSMPLFLYSTELQDVESGHLQDAEALTSEDATPATVSILNESPKTLSIPMSELWNLDKKEEHIYLVLKRDSEPDTNSPVTTPDKPTVVSVAPKEGSTDSKEEYFIASVQRTESITSEVYLNIEGNTSPARTYKIGKWEAKRNGSLTETPIEEESSAKEGDGKWKVLTDVFTQIEAFIRYESDAMVREQMEGKFPDDEDNDSVFE